MVDEASEVASPLVRELPTVTPAFKAWFGDSAIVNPEGEPLRVFHGTAADFSIFDPARLGEQTGGADARCGYFFAENPKSAEQFTWKQGEKSGSIMPAYLCVSNPMVSDHLLDGSTGTTAGKIIQAAKDAGHDGVVFQRSDMLGHTGRTFVAFAPGQIKSALGNNGDFDGSNTDIRFSLVDQDDQASLDAPYP